MTPRDPSVPTRPNLVIRASAGSGKTFRLTSRFIDLLLDGESPERIFATTFTRKAAAEILARVLARLSTAYLDAEARAELGRHLRRDPLDAPRVGDAMLRVTRTLDRLRVDTLDSFFVRLATLYSADLHLTPGWRIADPHGEVLLRERSVVGFLRREGTEAVRTLANLLSRGEVRRSVTQQILDLVAGLYPLFLDAPDEERWLHLELGTALDQRALERAIDRLLTMPLPLTRAGAPAKSWKSAVDTLGEAARAGDWRRFADQGLVQRILDGADLFDRRPISEEWSDAIRPLIDHAAHELIHTLGAQTRATFQLLRDCHAVHAEFAQRAGLFTFDAITRILAGATAVGALDEVYYRLDARLHHLLLDEFQDTSIPQWRVLEPLAIETCAAPEDHSFFCVGDAKQSIYGWRGGEPRIFGWLDRDIPGLTTEPMDQSHRSAPEVIDVVNRVFENTANLHRRFATDPLRGEPGVDDWLEEFRPHRTARLDLPGYVRMEAAPHGTPGQAVTTLTFAAQYVRDLVRREPSRSVGVLLRRNQAVSRMIHELRQLGIAASDEGGNPLTDSPAVSVVLSLLKLADHPGDGVAAFHVATSPLAALLQRHAHAEDRTIGADDPAPHRHPAVRRLARRVRRDVVDRGIAKAIAPAVEVLAIASGPRDRRRLEQLLVQADRFVPAGPLRATDFVRTVTMEKVDDPESAIVRVMNIHQSKGLEFDRVVLAELDQRIPGQTPPVLVARDPDDARVRAVTRFPNKALRNLARFVGDGVDFDELHTEYRRREIRESLSLLYVALTRAERELYLIVDPRIGLQPSFAGVLRGSLTDGHDPEPREVLFEHGRPPAPRLVRVEESAPVEGAATAGKSPATTSSSTRTAKTRGAAGRRVRTPTHPSE
ncbi:MAG: UvrD-helicase domain-containing protein, partial [Planctomycetes bacterium]|nr:UvrD-helicase domain-containing protein [Planctomycetota bacterium]